MAVKITLYFGKSSGIQTFTIPGGICFILLILDPLVIADPGFQLSYISVLGIACYRNPYTKCVFRIAGS